MGSGLASQIGFGEETTPGTRQAASRFFEFVSETLKCNRSMIESKGLRAGGRRVGPTRWAQGKRDVTGGVVLECAPQGFGILLKHLIGAPSTTGSGPYTHTFNPGSIDATAFTIQVGRPDIGGTVRPFEYVGCSINGWGLDAEIDAFLMLTLDIYGMDEDTSQTLATASYPATITPFTFVQGAVTVNGSAHDVKKISLSGANNLATGRHQITATNPGRPKQAIEEGAREITGTFTSDFTDLTDYNRFKNGTETALSLVFTSGTSSLTISGNIRSDGETPNVPGPQLLEQAIPFKFLSSTSDAAAFSAVLVNGDSTP